jgi:transcriptional regulator with XRE-family HTH domain
MRTELYRRRVENGWTQESLASMLGCAQTSIGNWDRGIRFPEKQSVRDKLELIFDASIDELFEPEKETAAPEGTAATVFAA